MTAWESMTDGTTRSRCTIAEIYITLFTRLNNVLIKPVFAQHLDTAAELVLAAKAEPNVKLLMSVLNQKISK